MILSLDAVICIWSINSGDEQRQSKRVCVYECMHVWEQANKQAPERQAEHELNE